MHQRFDLGPEVRHQRRRVAIVIGADAAQSVSVILLDPPSVADLMGIVRQSSHWNVG